MVKKTVDCCPLTVDFLKKTHYLCGVIFKQSKINNYEKTLFSIRISYSIISKLL